MAIEKMKKLTILFPVGDGERFEEWLYSRAALHLVGLEREFTKISSSANPLPLDEQHASGQLAKAQELLAEFNAIHKPAKSFLDGMLPVKAVVTTEQMANALTTVNLDALYGAARKASEALKNCGGTLNLLALERKQSRSLAFLTAPLARIRSLKRVVLIAAEGSPSGIEHLSRDREAHTLLAWEIARRAGSAITILCSARRIDEAKCTDMLRAHGFRILEYPEYEGRVGDRLEEITREEEKTRVEMGRHEEELRRVLPLHLMRAIECIRGYWESEKSRAERARAMRCSKIIGVAKGYARATDVTRLIADMEREFSGVSVIVEDPMPGENVPVSIKLSRWWRPGRLMISMFGMPDYFTFDPTPFLMLVFLIFFGICFADVIYGLLLVALSCLLIRRYRRQESLREFFRLFLYAGVSTVIFGVLTGSWAADIYNPEYLGAHNLLFRIVQKTMVLDMLAKPVIALLAALIIGIMTQFYGIVMRMVRDAVQRNWRGLVFDGALWLVYLGGLLIFSVAAISGFGGAALKRASLAAVLVGVVGLILTQGRDQKGWGARLVTGFVSLYGIMGTYGTTSFVGDVLSYSRLLALGLNTYIVGMSFNIIAKIIPQILISLTSVLSLISFLAPVGDLLARMLSNRIVQGVIVISIMVFGHLFNFLMSILSAFVHSARLILLEFFGRFYQTGGGWFAPHGFTSESVEVIKH